MRYLLTSLVFFLCLPVQLYAAEAQTSLQIATQIASTGARQLALARVEREQPVVKEQSSWLEWERLHLTLLADLGRYAALLKHVEMLPADTPPDMQQLACSLAASAALQLKQPEKARMYLQRLLWSASFQMSGPDIKQARYQLIETYLEDNPVSAYQAMLKFQQDYVEPEPKQLQRLLRVLLMNDMAKEAATWLPQMTETDPLKIWVRLQVGMLSPEAAMLAARAGLKSGVEEDGWLVVFQAATLQNDTVSGIEAQEHLLNAQDISLFAHKITAAKLWQGYIDYAQVLGNQTHLLSGDDASWVLQATQWSSMMPVNARAFWAYLSVQAVDASVRERAKAEFYLSMLNAHMGTAMVRLVEQQATGKDDAMQTYVHLRALGSNLQQQEMLLALAQSEEAQGDFAIAADFALQGLALRERVALDHLTLQLYTVAVANLNRAGLVEDAKEVQNRLVKQKLIRDIPSAT